MTTNDTTNIVETIRVIDNLDHAACKLRFINNAVNFRKLNQLTDTRGLWYILAEIEETISASSAALSPNRGQEAQTLKVAA